MEALRSIKRALGKNERGFTLPEVMITIVFIGIVMAIASSTWFGVVESRAMGSATNQLASDLRLAHSSAANRLVGYQVVLTTGSSTYQIGPSGALRTRTLPDNTSAGTTATVTFCSNGRASASTSDCTNDSEPSITLQVRATDGSPSHNVELVPATSRMRVV